MTDIKSQIEDIKFNIKALIDAGALPDHIDLRSFQNHQGYNEYYLCFRIGENEDICIELEIWDTEDILKSKIQVYDFPENEECNGVVLPSLKDYLSKHLLLQFQDYPYGLDTDYYLNKSIPPEYVKETYIALALIIQDFFTDSLWYISLEHTWRTNPTPPH